ncbi:MAG: serine hydrolase, partial [Saprospiraceae bacterium]
LKTKLYEQAITLVKNKGGTLPLTELNQLKLGSLSLGAKSKTPFQWRMDSYSKVEHFQSEEEISEEKSKFLYNSLKDKYCVFVGLHNMSRNPATNFGLTLSEIQLIQKISTQTKVVIVSFGNPYALKNFPGADWLVQAYEDDDMMQDIAAQTLFGALGFNGKLPVTASNEYRYGDGIKTESLMRFGYSIPERVNINSTKLSSLDAITQQIVEEHAAPGGQLLVAREGKIIYHKAFGYLDYDKKNPVGLSDLYDLASVTKIASSTLAVMKLYEEGKISMDQPLANFLPDIKSSNKSTVTLTELMSHQSGLIAWIPFYKETLQKVKRNVYKPDPGLYSSKASASFNIPIANGMFLKSGYEQMIWNEILQSEMRSTKKYLYSDLGFYMIAHLINHLSGMPIDQYMTKNFYQPMGLTHTMYNPFQKMSINLIAPSEEDNYWRNRKVQGYVHDMGAAMLDGVSGHAGLFSNSLELGTLMQMLLNGGSYSGKKYLQESTIKYFASRQLGSTRRGLGFDMKELDPAKPQPAGFLASPNTFGHTGFTGTATWVDPDQKLVFVFLCNRTYPSMTNNKLHKREFRSRLLDAVYLAMEDQKFENPVYLEDQDK